MEKTNSYISHIFANGRIALIPRDNYEAAIEEEKEILVFCGGWSGGYARVIGANRVPDYWNINNGNDCFECYAYDVRDDIFTSEEMQKFYRVIVTDGIKVYMQTGEPATDYYGGFHDWDTRYSDYLRIYNPYSGEAKLSEQEFEELRHKIDVEKTHRMIFGTEEERESIFNAIKGYLH